MLIGYHYIFTCLICFQKLKDDDFVLVMTSDFHAETLKRCSPANNFVQIDATHGTNHYGFKLITPMVNDEGGHGIPVGHCISNTENTESLTVFFKELRKKCGRIKVDYILTDDAPMVIILFI